LRLEVPQANNAITPATIAIAPVLVPSVICFSTVYAIEVDFVCILAERAVIEVPGPTVEERKNLGKRCIGDLDALAQAVLAVSRLAALDAVREAEINPLIIHAEGAGVTVADAWIVPA
jgi:hypothetical protein